MAKVSEKPKGHDTERAAIVNKTAKITEVSPRHVRRVMDGKNKNIIVETIFMEALEGEKELEEYLFQRKNELLKEVEKLVPFNNQNSVPSETH